MEIISQELIMKKIGFVLVIALLALTGISAQGWGGHGRRCGNW